MRYMGKVARSYRLDEELVRRVEARAKDLGQSYTVFVERALEKALDGHVVARPVKQGDASREAGAEKAPRSPSVVPAPLRASVPPMQRARDLVGRDSAAMERQRKMNEAKGF